MKKHDLMRRLNAIARTSGLPLQMLREGRNHEIRTIGDERLVIPRHRKINHITARSIIAEAERMVGQ